MGAREMAQIARTTANASDAQTRIYLNQINQLALGVFSARQEILNPFTFFDDPILAGVFENLGIDTEPFRNPNNRTFNNFGFNFGSISSPRGGLGI